MSEVRVRFAPSPTGFFHIGSARTALFNWLYARHTGGKFILRIEDTDKERNTDEALRVLLDGMRWLGMDWDEGPEAGGDYGPYFQSQRDEIYAEYRKKLEDGGHLYEKDGAVWFRLQGERYTVFDERKQCEVEKVKTEPVIIDDAIKGRVERREEQDFVVFRSDGSPVFHFVNVVDDITMSMTHIIRGEDHLSNTSKHILLFNALGAPLPQFAHIPLILKSTGKGKMSKRDEGALVEDYEKRGYLPKSVVNAIALLGWSPKDDREILDIAQIIELFDLPGVQTSAARFDEQKMAHINMEHIRCLPVGSLAHLVSPILSEADLINDNTDEDYLQKVLELAREKLKSLETIPAFLGYFFTDDFTTDEKAQAKVLKKGEPLKRLEEFATSMQELDVWDAQSLGTHIEALAEAHGAKKFDYFPILRLATSGQGGGPDLLPMLIVMGKERVATRIDSFLSKSKS